MFDILIKDGNIVDGTGTKSFISDVAIKDGKIAEVGKISQKAKREIDADGYLVTPGWVDIHTHYDGQSLWDPYLTPSSWHGCTTVVMGNCGVGFAPVSPNKEQWLIELMESVEDIPGSALNEGIDWQWESFPEYLDALEKLPRVLDVGTQVPHCAVRSYVMGDRCIEQKTAGSEDIKKMADIVQEGLQAGALGFSTSRTIVHRTLEGDLVPGTYAGEAELFGIAEGMNKAGHGVLQMASDLGEADGDLKWMAKLSKDYNVGVSLNLFQNDFLPNQYKDILQRMKDVNANGANISAQVSGRTVGLILGLETTMQPFMRKPAYMKIANLPLEQRVIEMNKPEVRKAILSNEGWDPSPEAKRFLQGWEKMFRLGNPPKYEPLQSECLSERSKSEGINPEEIAYDILLEFDGKGLIYYPFLNYSNYNLDCALEMMMAPHTVFGGSDGGAHCGTICDVSLPTYNLSYWGRDRTRGEKVAIEWLVHKQTLGTALIHGLNDRGCIKEGLIADLNIIDLEELAIDSPKVAYDLPTGARRLVQGSKGYKHTIKSGIPIFEDGEPTSELPGRLIRGPQARIN